MVCSKCHTENPASAQFCVRCHATLRFVCPACHHEQLEGGVCEQCGVDFAKYAAVMEYHMETQEKLQHERTQSRQEVFKQALAAALTGGWSLVKYLRTTLRGE